MLAHSPPLPLIIDYGGQGCNTGVEDIVLALEQRERVHRIRLRLPVPIMQRLITVIEGEYLILEYLIMETPYENESTDLILTETIQAPRLRHVALKGFAIPIRHRLHIPLTAVGLVTLSLFIKHPSAYLRPNTLLRWISSLPQLDTLVFWILFPVSNRDVERQLMQTPITTHVTLPNLIKLTFGAASAYMEAFVRYITTPRLEKLDIGFSNQLTFSIPHLRQFMNTAENLRFNHARFRFYSKRVFIKMYPHEEAKTHTLSIAVDCLHLDWQVSSVAQISNALSQKFSAVEHLTFQHKAHNLSSEEHNTVDRTEWRKLLGSFSSLKTLRIPVRLGGEFSRCLRWDDGEPSLELLPKLQELIFSGSRAVRDSDAFTQFTDARKNAGRPVTLTRG